MLSTPILLQRGTPDKTYARIIAALGDDRTRYANAASLQAAAGIAPITTQSGNSRFVSARWSSSKFIKQTFHEYAGLSIAKCAWAKAYLDRYVRVHEASNVLGIERGLAVSVVSNTITDIDHFTGTEVTSQHNGGLVR